VFILLTFVAYFDKISVCLVLQLLEWIFSELFLTKKNDYEGKLIFYWIHLIYVKLTSTLS